MVHIVEYEAHTQRIKKNNNSVLFRGTKSEQYKYAIADIYIAEKLG